MPIPHSSRKPSFLDLWFKLFPKKQHAVIQTTLPDGYHSVNERMLHAAFQLLVDYVQVECAQELAHEEGIKAPINGESLGVLFLTRIVQTWKMPNQSERGPGEADHIAQEGKLAAELLYLYDWWTNVRPVQIEVINMHPDSEDRDIMIAGLERDEQQHLHALIALRDQEWF